MTCRIPQAGLLHLRQSNAFKKLTFSIASDHWLRPCKVDHRSMEIRVKIVQAKRVKNSNKLAKLGDAIAITHWPTHLSYLKIVKLYWSRAVECIEDIWVKNSQTGQTDCIEAKRCWYLRLPICKPQSLRCPWIKSQQICLVIESAKQKSLQQWAIWRSLQTQNKSKVIAAISKTKLKLKHRKNCECCPVSQLIVR